MLVVITGVSRGIGFELVKKFAADSNTTVVAVSRNIAPILKLKLTNVVPVAANIAEQEGRSAVVAAVRQRKKKVAVLFNNAGQLLNKPFAKIKANELTAVYTTNVFAPFLLTQALLPLFEKGAHVINTGSMGGFQGSSKFAGLSAYSSSKAALAGLTECLAEELKTAPVFVNCLAIGAVQTEMLEQAFPGYKAPLSAMQMAEFMQQFALTGHTFFNGKILPVSVSTP